MTSNLYKVGDWVYCEVSPFQPYVVRKIEELTKTPSGNVEAKVLCAFRLHDIPANVLQSVERYQPKTKEIAPNETKTETTDATSTPAAAATTINTATKTETYFEEAEVADLAEQQRYNLKHREVFYSKYTDTIAATSIRAKCSVLLFCEEIEKYSEYLSREDGFFYHLTYDPYQKSLVNDKGEIRVGFRFQTEIPPLRLTPNGSVIEESSVELSELEKKEKHDRVLRSRVSTANAIEIPIFAQPDDAIFQWCPVGQCLQSYTNSLTDDQIDKFLTLAKSVGTFARALDCNNAFKQPSLPLSAAAASRDITLQHALNVLHDNDYDIGKAALSLITANGPVLCKDEIEDWSPAEANLFEDALEKYGKDFNEIRKDYLPWKSLKSIIEYYYTWKTTDRYVQRKGVKSAEQESKLKQVYIPNHSKQNQSALIKSSYIQLFNQYDVHLRQSCESCGAPNLSTNQWYAYNPTDLVKQIMSGNANPTALANAQAQAVANILASNANANPANVHIYQSRLCADCWIYWKKFSLFKYPNARQERLNQLKNQVHKCSVNGCGKEFKQKQLLIKHCGTAHGYFAKTANPATTGSNGNERPQAIRNRTAFFLHTTPMTKAARLVCLHTIKLARLAKKPFKLVELAELNKEWAKEARNISEILRARQAAYQAAQASSLRQKLDVARIDVIRKNRARLAKAGKSNGHEASAVNGANGHENGHDDENSNDLVIDQDSADQPEYFKYFEKKCTEPCYTPEQYLFPKPTSEQINKYFLNLMTQNRKRTLEQANANAEGATGGSDGSGGGEKPANGSNSSQTNGTNNDSITDSGPVSKRSLIQNTSASAVSLKQQSSHADPQRSPQKSHRPVQALNKDHLPQEFYLFALPSLKTIRNEVEFPALRKLARKPGMTLKEQYQQLYQTFDKLSADSLAKLPAKLSAAGRGGVNGDLVKENTDVSQSSSDAVLHQNGDSNNSKLNHKDEEISVGGGGGGGVVVLD